MTTSAAALSAPPIKPNGLLASLNAGLPGSALCLGVTVLALGLQALETAWLGRAWLEGLVLAILCGAAVRLVWTPSERFAPGVEFCGKFVLELAVALLGLSVSAGALAAAGPALLAGIAVVVVISILASYGLGRAAGLSHRLSTLIACGNAICGNSAIAAVAPVIAADGDDVIAAIGFTAILGVGVVLGLPLLDVVLGLPPRSFGVLAGLTVYAVPQVLAATAPVSGLSVQLGALVKLSRVLMLGPVVLCLSLLAQRHTAPGGASAAPALKLKLKRLVPWFIIGFLAMMALRASGAAPHGWIVIASSLATWMTILSMAALGLGVEIGAIRRAGPRAIAVVAASLIVLAVLALGLIFWLRVG
jgi:uncharacterized integral membrane protein (TIGR00698 family)